MKLGVLFSGGKDSTYAAWLAKKEGHELTCLISVFSSNDESYMFHTPNINRTKEQAQVMNIPQIIHNTQGKKEIELKDLEDAIKIAIKDYKIKGIITGAIKSVYQASRIQKICDKLRIKCLNPIWQKDQIQYLKDLIKNKFKVVITGVSAYPLNETWLGREIDKKFVDDVIKLEERYKINPSGEGGEFESLVLDCPLYKKPLKIKNKEISGKDNSWKMEVEL